MEKEINKTNKKLSNQYKKIKVTTREKLEELYNCSALTFVGLSIEKKSLDSLINWIEQYSEISNPLNINIIKGHFMNEMYGLTGDNKYPDDLNIVSIKTNEIKNIGAIVIPRFEVGGRWFDDIVDNNKIREKEENDLEEEEY